MLKEKFFSNITITNPFQLKSMLEWSILDNKSVKLSPNLFGDYINMFKFFPQKEKIEFLQFDYYCTADGNENIKTTILLTISIKILNFLMV